MILSTFKIAVLSALCGLAAPALAAETNAPDARADTAEAPAGTADGVPVDDSRATHSRRVELPFLLNFRPPENAPARTAPRKAAPHPYDQLQLDEPLRAALDRDYGPAHRLAAIGRG